MVEEKQDFEKKIQNCGDEISNLNFEKGSVTSDDDNSCLLDKPKSVTETKQAEDKPTTSSSLSPSDYDEFYLRNIASGSDYKNQQKPRKIFVRDQRHSSIKANKIAVDDMHITDYVDSIISQTIVPTEVKDCPLGLQKTGEEDVCHDSDDSDTEMETITLNEEEYEILKKTKITTGVVLGDHPKYFTTVMYNAKKIQAITKLPFQICSDCAVGPLITHFKKDVEGMDQEVDVSANLRKMKELFLDEDEDEAAVDNIGIESLSSLAQRHDDDDVRLKLQTVLNTIRNSYATNIRSSRNSRVTRHGL